jgi:sugar phosphate isomerase/epimerase
VTIGLSEAEVMSQHVEQLAGAPVGNAFGGGGRGRGRGEMTPEQQAEARKAAEARQEDMRKWRAAASMDKFKDVRKKFDDAGIELRLLTYNMNVKTTQDADIEYGFEMAKALGVKGITTSTQVSMAKRTAPFADKYQIMLGFHGHDQVDNPDEVSTEETFKTVMAASNLHLKDRKKNHGANVPWGQGDTPIKEVLQLLKKNRYDFPGNIEFEYEGDPLIEVRKCLDYCRQALA